MPIEQTETMSSFFGEQVRRLRNERGLTQRALAALVGLSQAQISLHEKGEDVPASPIRPQYAAALGITPDDLEDLISRDRLKELLRANPVLSEEAKRSIEDYIDFAWERDREAQRQAGRGPRNGLSERGS